MMICMMVASVIVRDSHRCDEAESSHNGDGLSSPNLRLSSIEADIYFYVEGLTNGRNPERHENTGLQRPTQKKAAQGRFFIGY